MKKKILNFINYICDKVIPRIRALLVIFFWIERFFTFLYLTVLFLSNEFVKSKFKNCGVGVRIHGKLTISDYGNLSLGDNVHIGDNAFFRTEGNLTIGSNVQISRNLLIYTVNHRYEGDALPYDEVFLPKPVTIGDNVWVGMNVTIIPGVTIGEGAIIGMGAVVTSDVAPLAIVGGNPAKKLKFRDEENYEYNKQHNRFSGMSGYLFNR